MNKHEKEVVKAQLMSEKQTLRTIQAVYKKALQDVENKLVISNGKINTLLKDVDNLSDEEKSILQSQIYQRKMQRSLKSQLEIMLKDLTINQYSTVNEHLKNSYHNGYIGSLYTLNMQGIPLLMPIDPYLVHRAIEIDSKIKHGLYQNLVDKVDVFKRRIANDISRGIASSASYHDMASWIRHDTKVSVGKSMRIVRTEGNRVYNAATLDCGKGAKERGCDLVKVWDSTLDMKTRPTHRECDGQVRELNEDFKNANGEAKAPGQFGIASEDINCRCAVLIKPRWDVDSRFTKRDNESKEFKEFEGVKSYKEFKERYWESVDKTSVMSYNKDRGEEVENDNNSNMNRQFDRKEANSGAFANLKVPMQKKSVLSICRKYSIDTKGITFKIQRSEKLLSTMFFGSTDYNNVGRIDLFPNAFSDETELVKTILHEKCHVMQLQRFGKKYAQENLDLMERQAYRFESIYYNIIKKKG